MTEQPLTPARKRPTRTRRWAKIAALVIGALVLLAFLACGALMLWGSRRIQREIEAVKTLHEPTNWDELLLTDRQGHVVPAADAAAEREAASLYSRALAQSKGWNEALPRDFQIKLSKEALSVEEAHRLGEALSRYQEAIGLFRKAAQYDGIVNLPGASIELDQRQLDAIESLREGARLLSSQACYSASQGHGDEAADYCIVLSRYTSAFTGYNEFAELMDFALTSITCRTIENTQRIAPCSGEKLEALRSALGRLVGEAPLVRAFCGERVCGNYLFQSGWVKLPRFSLWPNHAAYLEVMRESVAVSREPFPLSLRKMEQLASGSETPPGPRLTFNVFAHMAPGVMNHLMKNGAQFQARIRVTLVSLAIRRARLDGMALPTSLQELVPKYLSAIPTDPFTGEPLKYRSDETGCNIYSVGPNGVDNGGAVQAAIGSGSRPEQHIVIRLPR